MSWLASHKESLVLYDAVTADISSCVELFVSQKDISFTTFKRCWQSTHLSELHVCRSEKIDPYQYNSCLFTSTLMLLDKAKVDAFPNDVSHHSCCDLLSSLLWSLGVLYALYTIHSTSNIDAPIRVSLAMYTTLRLITTQLELLRTEYNHQLSRIWKVLHHEQALSICIYDGPSGHHRLAGIYLNASPTFLSLLQRTYTMTSHVAARKNEINMAMETLGYVNSDPVLSIAQDPSLYDTSTATTSSYEILSFLGQLNHNDFSATENTDDITGEMRLQQLEEQLVDDTIQRYHESTANGARLLEQLERQISDVIGDTTVLQQRRPSTRRQRMRSPSPGGEICPNSMELLLRLENATADVIEERASKKASRRSISRSLTQKDKTQRVPTSRRPRTRKAREERATQEQNTHSVTSGDVDIAALLANLESNTAAILDD